MTRRTPRRPPGRPTLLTPQTEQRILLAIETGTPITAACQAAGIHYTTLNQWQHRGENARDLQNAGMEVPEKDRPFIEFVDRVAQARARGLEKRLKRVEEIAEGGFVTKRTTRTYSSKSGPVEEVEESYAAPDWRALAWVLERSHREFFGREAKVELTGAGGGPVQVAHGEVDALAARIRASAERVAERLNSQAAEQAGAQAGGERAAIEAPPRDRASERIVSEVVEGVILDQSGHVVGPDNTAETVDMGTPASFIQPLEPDRSADADADSRGVA